MSVEWTNDELKEFDRLTKKASSFHQLDRIHARLEMPKFIAKHGKEKCDAMFAELQRRDRRRGARE